ncbi:hypothetical protein EJB05_35197, partial [Eragrostis curvula]
MRRRARVAADSPVHRGPVDRRACPVHRRRGPSPRFAKDRFVERQPRTTAQNTRLIIVDLVKYYDVFPVMPAFMEWGRKGYFQTQRSKTVMTSVLTVRSGLDPHMIRVGWMGMVLAGSHLDAASG